MTFSWSGRRVLTDPAGAASNTGALDWFDNPAKLSGPIANSPDGGNFIAQDGAYYPKLLYQDISGLQAGQSYTLSFDFAEAQSASRTGDFWANWNVDLGNQEQDANSPNSATNLLGSGEFSGWLGYSQVFTLTAADFDLNGNVRLGFLADGGPGSPIGGVPPFTLLDGVRLDATGATAGGAAVPEPSMLISSLLVFGVFGAVWVYKRVRQPAAMTRN